MATISYERPAVWDLLFDGYNPFPWQAEHIHSRTEDRIVAACGRRSGKTTALVPEAWKELLRPSWTVHGMKHAALVYVVAPTYELTMKMWEPFLASTYKPGLDEFIKDNGRDKKRAIVDLKNGARIQAKSADNAISLQGDPVTLALCDESHNISEEAWSLLMPSLLDSHGRLIAIGIPKGRGRFRSYWHLGQMKANEDAEQQRYYSFSVPSRANPVITEAMIEDMREDMVSETDYQQQILAKWVDEEGEVFLDVDASFDGSFHPYDPSHKYLMGLDLARKHDYTVAYVVDLNTGGFVHRYRVTSLDYPEVQENVAAIYRQYQCLLVNMDATGLGDPIAGGLRRLGCSVVEHVFTNASKARIIGMLNASMQHHRVHFAAEDDQLRQELKLVEATVLPSGGVRYDHPKGFFDDCVIAAALAMERADPFLRPNRTKHGSYANFKNRRKRRVVHA